MNASGNPFESPLITPVAFILFNRPDLTLRVFQTIRQAKPRKLFVIGDGPRNAAEKILCEKARSVIDQVDWDCEVATNFSEANLGCRNRIASGLDWRIHKRPSWSSAHSMSCGAPR